MASGGFHASTPISTGRGRMPIRESPLRPRGPRLTARDWSFMQGGRNRRRRRNLQRKINYSDEGEISVAPELNKKTGLRWRAVDPRKLKFVDDFMILSKINMDSATAIQAGAHGRPVKSKHDIQSQNVFRRVAARAEARGMVVNKKKTQILRISDALTYHASACNRDADGTAVSSGPKLKVLGFQQPMPTSRH